MAIKIGNILLGSAPVLTAVITEISDISKIRRLSRYGVSILEIRIDLIKESFKNILSFLKDLKKRETFAILGTIRETINNRKKRLELFRNIMPFVDCVDIEWDTPINKEVIKIAVQNNVRVIISHHDFEKTPDIRELLKIIKKTGELKADITKIAVTAITPDDVMNLLMFTKDNKEKGLITLSMGIQGSISRVIAPFFGSLLAYGFTTESVAPGQMSVTELHKELNKFYPSYHTDLKMY
ncbi:MAG: type I 3-dehydroquinate dehydratase [bacterium]